MTEVIPRILLVGAYERDNFGDLLFLLMTEQYLKGLDVTAAAPFPRDMTALLERKIPAYGPLLAGETFDHVWSVGGEVGATSAAAARRMWSSGAGSIASRDVRRDGARAEDYPMESPYLPRPTAYPRNAGASFVINSAGLGGIARLPLKRRALMATILREADVISVRDNASSTLLQGLGIEHVISPDIVHAVALSRKPVGLVESRVALVQASSEFLGDVGIHQFGRAVAQADSLAGHRIKLVLAGTAPGHDSIDSYQQLVAAILHVNPRVDVEIWPERQPWRIVDEIASSAIWIGSSLHGRIIAASYDRPRVSLAKGKVDAYAQAWDPGMPYGVGPRALDAAVARATSIEAMDATHGLGARLGKLADENIMQLVDAVRAGDPSERLRDRLALLESYRRTQELRWLASPAGRLQGMLGELVHSGQRVVRRQARGVMRRYGR